MANTLKYFTNASIKCSLNSIKEKGISKGNYVFLASIYHNAAAYTLQVYECSGRVGLRIF